MSYTEQQLRTAVDAVFKTYDTDNSQSLEGQQVKKLINGALGHLKANRQVSSQEISQFIKAVDKSGDGKIQKSELFDIFKKILS